jgi:hypothetical protein
MAITTTPWKNTPPWLPVNLPPSARVDLHSIVAALDPEGALRYRKQGSTTFCNIFTWDVSRAAGDEIPHWYDEQTGAPLEVGNGIEMHANRQVEWLDKNWTPMPEAAARDAAATGYLVICGWRNPGGIGHVSVLLPEGTTAQAGGTNFVGKPVSAGFGKLPVRFFVSKTRLFTPPAAP